MNRNMEAITWSLHARGISPTARVLLTELCGHVNSDRGDYAVWPSHRSLADAVEVSVATIKRHLKELVDAEYLSVRAGVRTDGGRSSNVYDLAVDSTHRMPRGRVVRTKAPPVQYDPYPIGQIELASQVNSEPGSQVTRDLCKEPLESGTSERKKTPPLPSGEPPQPDLLQDVSASTALIAKRPPLLEHVSAGWESLTARFERIPKVRAWSASRQKAIARRAEEVVRASAGLLDAHQVWDQIFAAIAADPWLRGEADPGRGYDRAYVVEIDHVLRTGGTPNFLWILERAATNDRDHRASSDPRTGRRFGPAEQATHDALARLRAGRERREG